MQMPICSVCLGSDILCSGCGKKFQDGLITQMDIDVSKYLFELSEKITNLDTVKLNKIIDSDVLVMVAEPGDAPKLVGKNGAVVKALAKKFNKSIRVLESAGLEKFSRDLLSPTPIVGVNKVFKEDGEVLRVRAGASSKNKLLVSPESFSKIVQDIYGKRAELVLEG